MLRLFRAGPTNTSRSWASGQGDRVQAQQKREGVGPQGRETACRPNKHEQELGLRAGRPRAGPTKAGRSWASGQGDRVQAQQTRAGVGPQGREAACRPNKSGEQLGLRAGRPRAGPTNTGSSWASGQRGRVQAQQKRGGVGPLRFFGGENGWLSLYNADMREIFRDEFSTYHPLVNVVFFLGAIVLAMFFIHPAYTTVSLVLSVFYLLTLKKRRAFRELLYMLILFVGLSVINPIFNRMGATVLFRYFGRPYTLEALIYGMTLAGMTASVLCWFACYNSIMTSDKFIYIFGRVIPSVSLVLSMILRLIPNFIKKTKQISSARASIGLAGDSSSSRIEKIRNGTQTLSALTSWALEGGIITADSMRSRGYGSGKRTAFAKYRFDARNIVLLVVFLVLLAVIIFCAANGSTKAVYYPFLSMTWFGDFYMTTGIIAYGIFLILPACLEYKEKIKWRILRSGT